MDRNKEDIYEREKDGKDKASCLEIDTRNYNREIKYILKYDEQTGS
jgi:hypothetical protein